MKRQLFLVFLGVVLCSLLVYAFSFRTSRGVSGKSIENKPEAPASGTAPAPSQPNAVPGSQEINGTANSPQAETSKSGAGTEAGQNALAESGSSRLANTPAAGEADIPPLVMKTFSSHDIATLTDLAPQQQAEQMMMAAVNHYEGATGMVMDRVQGWRGHLQKTANWDQVELAARYSSDLRVRDAAIEVDLTMYALDRNTDTAERLIHDAQNNTANRGFDFTMLGMLANRGVESGRIHSILRDWAHDADEGTRYWAIEGLAYIGTVDTIPDFLEVLRNDPSLNVRQRCGASLAKSGMLTREQRMNAVPGLIEIAADSSQNTTTRGWAFQALREITAEPLGNDVDIWRTWFEAHGSGRLEQFRRGDRNHVLGNS